MVVLEDSCRRSGDLPANDPGTCHRNSGLRVVNARQPVGGLQCPLVKIQIHMQSKLSESFIQFYRFLAEHVGSQAWVWIIQES